MHAIKRIFTLFLLTFVHFLIGCAQQQENFNDDTSKSQNSSTVEQVEPSEKQGAITLEEATYIAFENGVNAHLLVYKELMPSVVVGEEVQMDWGFIEEYPNDIFHITFIDYESGKLLQFRGDPWQNILDFITQNNIGSDVAYSSTPNAYDSFPWGWRLPFESSSNVWMTCGYGCGYHTGNDAYATDWDPGNEGHLLESAASCWVTSVSTSTSYGNQVVAECGDAGSGQRYYYRAAHLRDTPLVSVGQWIGKGRNIGYMGSTGWATGAHVHYVVYRGVMSGSSLTSGSSLPISRWPSSSDSLCDGDLSSYNFNTSSFLSIGSTGTSGCP
ncbi:MAG: M23 family metallopeptidase [Candidatus Kerfeldbacteria bacterium]|nr:M23 family metallopeptidase [Candidatus Kerfeldbacteria bacterium]